MHIRATHFPDSPLSLHFSHVVRAGRLRASVSTHSGRSFTQGRTRENEPVSKNAKL